MRDIYNRTFPAVIMSLLLQGVARMPHVQELTTSLCSLLKGRSANPLSMHSYVHAQVQNGPYFIKKNYGFMRQAGYAYAGLTKINYASHHCPPVY